jgi:hypothetical protein
MANIVRNHLVVIGLKESPEEFAQALETELYGRAVPHEAGDLYVEVVDDEFRYDTKWEPKIDALVEFSKVRKDHVFLVSYGCWEIQRRGRVVISDGKVIESIERTGYLGLFDEVTNPCVDLFDPYLHQPTLAQCATNRLNDAIRIVRQIVEVMDDPRFTASPDRPFSEVRDRVKTQEVHVALVALADTMAQQLAPIDFSGVFLEETDLRDGLQQLAETNANLMASLGLDHLVPDQDRAVRFAILPFRGATSKEPNRIILPVVHYLNADPISGKYSVDGSTPEIEWKLRYVCLTRPDIRQIVRLPDEGQKVPDLDLVMRPHPRFDSQIDRISNNARWESTPTLSKAVETAAAEMSEMLTVKLSARPGITIIEDFNDAVILMHPEGGVIAPSGPDKEGN